MTDVYGTSGYFCHVCSPQHNNHVASFSPGIWFPSYLMSISCRPLSVGWYLMVIVPSLLSVICGRAVLPEGIRTSPGNNSLVSCQWPKKFVFKTLGVFLFFFCCSCLTDGVCPTCDFSLLWREGDKEVNGTEERIDSIAGNDGLICGLSRQERKQFHKHKRQNNCNNHTRISRINALSLTTTWKGLLGMFWPPKRMVITYLPGSGAV